ncbi:MAG: electron transfer flavoprotein subunit alpha/FixB family protein [bacterium]|nr:electron transfer flavoprotein subunit alpha/FixB family protein [bacterium]
MSKKIWIVLQQREGKLHRMSREAIAAGQQLASALGGTASAVLLSSDGAVAGDVLAYQLDEVLTASDAALADYTPGGYVGALGPAIGAEAPDYVLFPHTYQSVDYVPRLAQETGAALVPEAVSFEVSGEEVIWKRPVLTGKLQARVRVKGGGTVLATIQSGAFPADSAAAGSTQARSLTVGELVVDREILGVEQAGEDEVDLTKADIIVGVGRGVGGPEKLGPVEELARLIGGDIGASRPVIDNGWLPRDRQIGSSGQTVAPKLYLAVGISGAIQHQVGMKGSSCVVAINKDKTAPIFNIAKYGVIGDLHEIVPAINEVLAESQD